MLSVVTPAGAEPLHLNDALAHIKQDAGIDDAHVLAAVSAARVTAETRTWRSLVATRFKQTMDGFPGLGQSGVPWGLTYTRPENAIVLDRCPVLSVESIQYLGMDGVNYVVPAADYTVVLTSEPCRITPVFGKIWPIPMPQIGSMWVTFVAGFATPVSVNAAADTICLGLWKLLSVGDVVRLSNSGGTLPMPLAVATDYYIQAVVSPGVYKLAASSGGAAIDLTDAGSGQSFVGEVPADILSWLRLRLGTIDSFREEVAIMSRGKIEILPFVDGLLDCYTKW